MSVTQGSRALPINFLYHSIPYLAIHTKFISIYPISNYYPLYYVCLHFKASHAMFLSFFVLLCDEVDGVPGCLICCLLFFFCFFVFFSNKLKEIFAHWVILFLHSCRKKKKKKITPENYPLSKKNSQNSKKYAKNMPQGTQIVTFIRLWANGTKITLNQVLSVYDLW
jgi:hypothetical protein